jgi:hypothetical protein
MGELRFRREGGGGGIPSTAPGENTDSNEKEDRSVLLPRRPRREDREVMASRVALLLAALVGASVARAEPPELLPAAPPPPEGPAAGSASPFQDWWPVREGVDFTAGYLMWWLKKGDLPALVTTSSDPAQLGILGRPTTQVVFGGPDVGAQPFQGGRFALTGMIDQVWSLEAGGFFISQNSKTFQAAGGGTTGQLLAIPVINAVTGLETSVVIASPGGSIGAVSGRLFSRLWGVHTVATACVGAGEGWAFQVLAGGRYADLTEAVRLDIVRESATPGTFNGAAIPGGTVVTGEDSFHTRNQFYGCVVGGFGDWHWGGFVLSGYAQVSVGGTHEEVRIHGTASATTPAGTTRIANADVLAQFTNIGRPSREVFGFLPEAGLTVGYQLSQCVSVFAGYDFLYWSRVARPGDQIDRRVNLGLVPFLGSSTSPAAVGPMPVVNSTEFWAQGLSCGVHFSF